MDSSSGIAVGFIKQGQCYGCSLECFIEFSEQQFWEGTTLCKQLSFDIGMPIIYWYLRCVQAKDDWTFNLLEFWGKCWFLIDSFLPEVYE